MSDRSSQSRVEVLEPLVLMSASAADLDVFSALVFDLDRSDDIGVTGETTGQDKSDVSGTGLLVEFDIDSDGVLEAVEWIEGSGDGILVDKSKIENGTINGSALIGDEAGLFANGYEKLALSDDDGNNLVEDFEFSNLALWVDDGDAILESGEIKDLAEELIFSISVRLASGNSLMQSSAFLLDDSEILTESVWFASAGDVLEDSQPDEPLNESNETPVANDDLFITEVDSPLELNVLDNDFSRDGTGPTIAGFAQPSNGTVTTSEDGSLVYTPNTGFVGVDYFVYTVTDGEDQSLATVRIDVVPPTPTSVPDVDVDSDADSGLGSENRNGIGPVKSSGTASPVGQAIADGRRPKDGRGNMYGVQR